MYLDQFLVKNEEPQPVPSPEQPSKKEEANSVELDEDFSLSSKGKFNPSAFHNFQKHLTVCLKHSIEIKAEDRAAASYEKVAAKLWKAFKQSSTSTKKVLHYLLGERNEHKITEAGLKEFGLSKIYEEAGDSLAAEARKYLASETMRQIEEGKLEAYIEAKKLKDKSKFKKYVQIFVEELEQGFLRKRLPKDKVMELQRS
jgi:hypothetical protein